MRPSPLLILLAAAMVVLTAVVALTGVQGTRLIVSLWLVLGGIALLDLMLTPGKRSLGVTADLPEQIFVGTSQFAQITFEARAMPRALEMELETPEGLQAKSDGISQTVEGAVGDFELICQNRGSFAIDHLWLRWPSRFGFFEVIAKKFINATVKGIPNIQPILSGEITSHVNAELFGIKTTAMRGEGSDFHQLREFTSGMDTRMIDWKRSARHNALVARETHVEQNHQIIVCLDNGYLMREELAGLPKIDHAINAGLAVTWAAGIGGDQVGFYTFDSRPQRFLPPQPGRKAFNRIRAEAAELAYSEVESNHTLAMAHLNGQLNRRSLIVVFSDFVDSITAELFC